MNYSFSSSNNNNNNNEEMYSMNSRAEILEYGVHSNNTKNHDLHLMNDADAHNTTLDEYDVNRGAIVVVGGGDTDDDEDEDYSDHKKNDLATTKLVPWYKRKMYIAIIIVLIGTITIILATVLPSRGKTSSPYSLQSGHSPDGGPYIATPEVDQSTMQSNIDQMLGDFLASKYNELGVPNWNAALQNTTTPQGIALRWITGRTNFPSLSQLARVQRYALAVFYYSTFMVDHDFMTSSPTGWTSAELWISDQPECQWEGIICDGNSAVTSIILSSHDLSGSLPHELAMLSSIAKLDLMSNFIYMEDTLLDVFLHMSSLKVLRMEDNFVVSTTGLPTQFKSLTNIESIQLSYNLLQGTMNGTVIGSLKQLQLLEIESNYLSGVLPSELALLPNLVYLYARRNMFDFRLDEFITGQPGTFPQIFSLWIDTNTIRGTIPTSIGLLTGLASFSITNASLTGTIPTEFGKLTDMKRVWLYDNELSGTIPTQLVSLQQLEVFEIHTNNINGTMPTSICQYVSQSDYDLSTVTADCTKISCECCTVCY